MFGFWGHLGVLGSIVQILGSFVWVLGSFGGFGVNRSDFRVICWGFGVICSDFSVVCWDFGVIHEVLG